jgi:hypothetical protein
MDYMTLQSFLKRQAFFRRLKFPSETDQIHRRLRRLQIFTMEIADDRRDLHWQIIVAAI